MPGNNIVYSPTDSIIQLDKSGISEEVKIIKEKINQLFKK
jgi:hypothetical protein